MCRLPVTGGAAGPKINESDLRLARVAQGQESQTEETMGMKSKLTLVAACFAALATLSPIAGHAEDKYPNRAITLVVPFAAGGTTDIIARLLAQKIGGYSGQTVLVENVPGAATMIATEKVAHARPDGYTIYLASSTPFATNPNFYSKLRYSIDDFAPICLISRVPLILDVNPKFPANNVKEFIAYAKSKPDGVSIATPGRGSVGEIVNGMTSGILGIRVNNIPYRGGAPAVADVLKGVVDAYYDAISSSLSLYHGGAIKSLAITGRKRSPAAPDVPTMLELGYEGFVLENVYGMFTTKGTPKPIIDQLNVYIRRALDDPDFRAVLLKQGVVPEPSTPEELLTAVKEDYEFNARMVARFKIPPVQ